METEMADVKKHYGDDPQIQTEILDPSLPSELV
jgi:hypothetical protein